VESLSQVLFIHTNFKDMQLRRSSKYTSFVIRFSLAGLLIVLTFAYALANEEPQKSVEAEPAQVAMTEFEFTQKVLEMDRHTKPINLQNRDWQLNNSEQNYPEGFIIHQIFFLSGDMEKPKPRLKFLNKIKGL
jgi:hypothetical protein